MLAHKVQFFCCLVFRIVILVIFLFVKGIHVVCKMCKSFLDRKKRQMQIHKQAAVSTEVACWLCVMPIIK